MRKYVITGGPGIGKTSVIEVLASRGFTIVPEAARIIVEEEKLKGSDALPWRDIGKFQEKVVTRQLALENSIHGNEVFLDRSIIDGYAYCKNAKVPVPQAITENARSRYDKVFLLDPIDTYETDSVRFESLEEGQKIHSAIISAYKTFGYELNTVPRLPPEQRADFIINLLGNK